LSHLYRVPKHPANSKRRHTRMCTPSAAASPRPVSQNSARHSRWWMPRRAAQSKKARTSALSTGRPSSQDAANSSSHRRCAALFSPHQPQDIPFMNGRTDGRKGGSVPEARRSGSALKGSRF
jgi:hypothetical protein